MTGLSLLLCAAALVAETIPNGLEASWKGTLADDSKGYGVVVGSGTPKDWVEPNLEGAFAIGFDTHNPRSTNWFNAEGNIYGRPEREVSLHFNGREIANRVSQTELKGTDGHKIDLKSQIVVGGSEVTLKVNGTPVYDRYFVPGLYLDKTELRIAGEGKFDKPAVKWGKNVQRPEPATRVKVFDKALNNAQNHRWSSQVEFPKDMNRYGRVIATLTLEATPQGIDPWDRLAQAFIVDDKGRRIELVRWITPYDKGWVWTLDVTDLLPLFQGTRQLEGVCETWGAGWLVSLDLDLYPGRVSPRPFKVTPIWSATAEIGNPAKPLAVPLPATGIKLDGRTKKAVVRSVVTGHGMSPNTGNAAEFLSLWRKIWVGSQEFQNRLWKEDNYLNPCRPQGGTWKFDRAGWAPGDVVTPWYLDITKAAKAGTQAVLRYEIQPYLNETPVDGNPARHVVEAVLVEYR